MAGDAIESEDGWVTAMFADGPLAGLQRPVSQSKLVIAAQYVGDVLRHPPSSLCIHTRVPRFVFHVYSWRSLDPPVLEYQHTRDTP